MTVNVTSPVAFLTGGTGMLGSHLARRLRQDGYRVRALVRPTSRTEELKSLGVELFTGDVTDDPSSIRAGLTGVTHVFHCAALVADWASREEMVRVNVEGLRNVLRACVGLPIHSIVVVSSLAVYGLGPQRNLDETAPLVHSGDNYNFTKIESEHVAEEFVREHHLPIVIIRPPYIYGEGDRQFFPRLVETLHDGKFVYVAHGEVPLTLAYVGNVVEAMVRAAGADVKGGEDFIITDGESITRRELVETICEVMGYPKPQGSVPLWLARMLCPVYELVSRLSGGKRPPRLNKFRLKFMATELTFDIGKARELIGYDPPYPMREALRRSIQSFRDAHPELRKEIKT